MYPFTHQVVSIGLQYTVEPSCEHFAHTSMLQQVPMCLLVERHSEDDDDDDDDIDDYDKNEVQGGEEEGEDNDNDHHHHHHTKLYFI